MRHFLMIFFFAAIFPSISNATVIFEDDFNDGDMVGWEFSGINPGPWSAATGEMQSASTQTAHIPAPDGPGAALISGIVTPAHFSLEADIRVIGDVPNQTPGDWGHVGFVWGWSDSTHRNTSYLRIHSDHVTSFGTPGGAENFLSVPGAVNDAVYHMKVEVDANAQMVSLTVGGNSTTFTGVDYQEININSGGSVGLITWGERVGYDNVVLTDLTISEPMAPVPTASFWALLLLTVLLGLIVVMNRRRLL